MRHLLPIRLICGNPLFATCGRYYQRSELGPRYFIPPSHMGVSRGEQVSFLAIPKHSILSLYICYEQIKLAFGLRSIVPSSTLLDTFCGLVPINALACLKPSTCVPWFRYYPLRSRNYLGVSQCFPLVRVIMSLRTDRSSLLLKCRKVALLPAAQGVHVMSFSRLLIIQLKDKRLY